jgi:3-methyladenine DNA glycosylase/8-oxoguanine DNA glycosylase
VPVALAAVEREARPTSPYRLPTGSSDRTLRPQRGGLVRLLQVEGSPVLVRAWQRRSGTVSLRAEAVDPAAVRVPLGADRGAPPAREPQLQVGLERLRFALGVDEDLGDFHRRFRRDPLLGPLLRRRPSFRPKRAPWPWEALQTAIVKQLIEAERAAVIERRIVGRWGPRLGEGREALRDVPGAATIAGRAPAELEAMDLTGARAAALRRVAREVAAGRCRPGERADDRRLTAIPQIGPWTVQCLALFGRGEMDALPAGDLAYLKLVGRLAGLGRRATIPEVEEFYAPYEPYRGLAGTLTIAGLHRTVAQGPPLRLAA